MKTRDHTFLPRQVTEFLYPESDGQPMGETDTHRDAIVYLIEALKLRFRPDPGVYVTGDILLYYVEGDSNQRVCPDVFVVKGSDKHERRVFKTWEEGKGPAIVIEVSSKGSKSEDLGRKKDLYQDVLKVREYVIYDPLREYLPGRLRAWARKGSRLVERRVAGGRFFSRELELELVVVHDKLRLVDPATGRELPDLAGADAARAEAEAARGEAEAARAKAEEGRAAEAAARRKAEAEAQRLREELNRLRERGRP